MIDDTKCAPGNKYVDGSCISKKHLIDMAEKWNSKNKNNIIKITQDKQELVNQFEEKLSDKCSDQVCWLRLDFIKKLENEDLLDNTFRPYGPTGKYEWLSTTDIDNVINQYQTNYKEFLFLGAVPYDFDNLKFLGIYDLDFEELEKSGKYKIGMVINLDEHYKSGSHWVGLYTNLKENKIYFFDSVGKKPRKRIKKFINRITKYLYNKNFNEKLNINSLYNKLQQYAGKNNIINNLSKFDIRYNHIQHQFKDSECGVYSIHFITRLVEGESFDSIINNVIKDDVMNQFRKQYFINVN
jgi:hypothetical protein